MYSLSQTTSVLKTFTSSSVGFSTEIIWLTDSLTYVTNSIVEITSASFTATFT